jgi:NADPH2:quinone reductase
MKAIQVTEFGGPEVLKLADVDEPQPFEGGALVDVSAAGINYADTHQIENSYLSAAELPLIPGGEVVGIGPDGKRIVALIAGGGYAEKAVVATQAMWEVPDGVNDGEALSIVLQGVTAWHILRTSAKMAEGESVVVHAAAGGVGTIAVQLAKRWGAGRVIATASSDEKRELALSLGADVAIDSNIDNLKEALETANEGRKVDVVLEMTGGPVFDASLAALAPFGRLVTYGAASRQAAKPIEPGSLISTSRGVIGFWLVNCIRVPGMLGDPIERLLRMVAAGDLKPIVGGSYPLADARQAHEDLRGRRTTGKLVLVP